MSSSTSAPSSSHYSVYLLLCVDGTLYAGCTNDIDRRLLAHGRGTVRYTRGRLPVTLVYLEPIGERGAALRCEAALKRFTRREKLALTDVDPKFI
jgi:putative endonuclease